ncbi:Hint domain-containing protein [Pelagovum pacificum]|uniref:Hedgehog/Intein (Hint) domain-containing protein n=1 Tax=Pelagovum pacificum TaxID=2588711 RepID=A0A5C5GEF9_9RHOB|nr:Hint domain-containing protein [Pelagovum pacificum]QQA44294.1 Hint domain-containing protein [Pelagovum pacificum]TNY32584.1 hypothetical protein FHY64_04690 [Pelagovum pacificum]
MDLDTQSRALGAGLIDQFSSADISGLFAGTTVMTMDGEMPVDHLTVGDRIITRDTGVAVLRDVRVTEVEVMAVRVKAGSLGHSRPDEDMILPPGAMVHIRDWRAEAMFGSKSALVPVRRLIDGEFIAEGEKKMVRVYDLVFDQQHILYANGLEVASAG